MNDKDFNFWERLKLRYEACDRACSNIALNELEPGMVERLRQENENLRQQVADLEEREHDRMMDAWERDTYN